MFFTEIIRNLLTEKNISINKMLKDNGLGSGTFATWEENKRYPRADILANLADYLGVSVDYLLDRHSKNERSITMFTEENKRLQSILEPKSMQEDYDNMSRDDKIDHLKKWGFSEDFIRHRFGLPSDDSADPEEEARFEELTGYFNQLNPIGQGIAVDRVRSIVEEKRYIKTHSDRMA